MKFSNKILSQTITELCLSYGIDQVVISPGSRNAPLIIGFTENSKYNCYSIVDERSAAFFALGLAQQSEKPVAIVCTSGSALLNYYPAIAEAFYSDIPLVVISADRPAHLIDVGDGQTIRQEKVFANHILFSANCKEGEAHHSTNQELINKAICLSINDQGPVHINAPFSEPLYETTDVLAVTIEKKEAEALSETDRTNCTPFLEQWNKAKRKMVLVGVLAPSSIEQQYLDMLAKDPSVIILTETTSNLHHPDIFPAIDQLIAPLNQEAFENLQPELLLTFGGMVVSKKIKAFLRTFPPKAHWHIGARKAYDTYFKLKHHFQIDPNIILKDFLKNSIINSSNYNAHWKEVKDVRLKNHFEYNQQVKYSDFKVFSEIFKSLPTGIDLQLSNSATIRYSQLFDLHSGMNIYCNRGTSGIDGSLSTAIGAACKSQRQTYFISGDLSFFYDSNALWNNYIPNTFRIIVVNNQGGGIFRILPGAKEASRFKEFFETEHTYTAASLCEMYRIEYLKVTDEKDLKHSLTSFYADSDRPKLLEIFTPSELNDQVLKDYFDSLV